MGMYDTVRSSYDLGPGYKKDLQTKDLECCMCEYWISPSGQLFEIDYSGTQDFEEIPVEKRTVITGFYKTTPNGNHGKVRPVYVFKVVELYPAKWDAHYCKWPSCHVYFKDGMIQEVRHADLHGSTH